MVREISAGAVVVGGSQDGWQVAVIEPARARPDPAARKPTKSRALVVLALPKGLIDAGETSVQAALREVREETGLTARLIVKLGDVRYVYVRSWGDGQRVFKIVSFYLLRHESGTIDEIDPAMRVEVKQALWLAPEQAAARLAYGGERQMIALAREYMKSHPEVLSS